MADRSNILLSVSLVQLNDSHISSLPPILEAPRHIRSIVEPFYSCNLLAKVVLLWPKQDGETGAIPDPEGSIAPSTLLKPACFLTPYCGCCDCEFDESRGNIKLETLCCGKSDMNGVLAGPRRSSVHLKCQTAFAKYSIEHTLRSNLHGSIRGSKYELVRLK